MKVIGIDPGTTTGLAVWDTEKRAFIFIGSMMIHKAMEYIVEITPDFVRVEDARLRKYFTLDWKQEKFGPGVREGVGSIKRDCSIWEGFLRDKNIPFELVAPRTSKTKMTAKYFALFTGYQGSTNEHSRDAACLVHAFGKGNVKICGRGK